MKAPHFCHPETNRISLTREGSIFYNNAFVYRGVGNTCKFLRRTVFWTIV